ncbi:MAG: esterase-like activity of phytase family protein [Cyanophyceae cyanobacterium]
MAAIALLLGLTACSIPQVQAEDRLFVNDLAAEWVDALTLERQAIAGVPVGGLSALAYDRSRDRFLALSDARGDHGPARFYTLAMEFDRGTGGNGDAPKIRRVRVESATALGDRDGQPFPAGSIDPEGLALSPRQTVFISSEGDVRNGIDPFIGEFDRTTGRLLKTLPLPPYYLPQRDETKPDAPPRGIRNNLGFESLTVWPPGDRAAAVEPFRLFTATESNLAQDLDPNGSPDQGDRPPAQPQARFLHFLIGDGPPLPVSEHLYPLDPTPKDAIANGLVELRAIDGGGHFLSLERTFSLEHGYGVKLFQVAMGAATDTAGYGTYVGAGPAIAPARKRLLLDLTAAAAQRDISLFNLEGMAIGPRFPDGRPSLWLIADDNFQPFEQTQIVLLKLTGYRPG